MNLRIPTLVSVSACLLLLNVISPAVWAQETAPLLPADPVLVSPGDPLPHRDAPPSGAELPVEPGSSGEPSQPEDAAAAPLADETAVAPGTGELVLIVTDRSNGLPLGSAKVTFTSDGALEQTNDAGILRVTLPEGLHDLVIAADHYEAEVAPEVAVLAGKVTQTAITLVPAVEQITIRARRVEGSKAKVFEERREMTQVADIVAAEQISKAGDSNAAGALRRVTGLTLLDGKYVYVRGLGERYSATLLNDSQLPSPDPFRRVVPLDLFPSGMLESIVVQKSYTPDRPAEFGGGAIELRTVGVPDRFNLKGSIASKLVAGTSASGLRYTGGDLDFLGLDDGTRSMPGPLADAVRTGKRISIRSDFSEAELEALAESLPDNYDTRKKTLGPNLSAALSLGDRFVLGKVHLGYLGSLLYNHEWNRIDRKLTRYAGADGALGEATDELTFKGMSRVVNLSGLVGVSAEIGENHEISSVSLLTRLSDDTTRIKEGMTGNDDTIRSTLLSWVERQMFLEQVRGRHEFNGGPVRLDWRYNFAQASRDMPDTREYRYELYGEDQPWMFSSRSDGNQRTFSALDDATHDLGADLCWNVFENARATTVKLKSGYERVMRKRSADTRRFGFALFDTFKGQPEMRTESIERIFSAANIGGNGIQLMDYTRNTDSYSASQTIDAGFGMIDVTLLGALTLVGGVRVERSVQDVETFGLHEVDKVPDVASLDTTHFLPTLTATWRFLPRMQLRFGYSQTLARPDFRELSTATYTDDLVNMEVGGNPDLKTALIHNLDLRWEWYTSNTTNLSAGAFGKILERPIETVLVNMAGNGSKVTYENSKRATIYGLEADLLQSLGAVHRWLSDVFIGSNASFIGSRIQLSDQLVNRSNMTSRDRPLQGVSPYVINANLSYDNLDIAHTSTLLYNILGRRISEVGTASMPDIYEQPAHSLDYVMIQGITENIRVELKAQNLLGARRVTKQADRNILEIPIDRTFSLALKGTF